MMRDLKSIHFFLNSSINETNHFKNKGYLGSLIYIIFSSRKNRIYDKNISLSLPLNDTPQIIISLNKQKKYHSELYRYIGWYSSVFLKIILKCINIFGLPKSFKNHFIFFDYNFNFILNTHNKLILFEDETDCGIFLKKYLSNNFSIKDFYSKEKYLIGSQFNHKIHTDLILNYLIQKNKNKELNPAFDKSLLKFIDKNIVSKKLILNFYGFYEHGDFVLSNVRFNKNKVEIYDKEESNNSGFLFTDISTFLISFLSGEPLMNKIWIFKFMLYFRKKWFLTCINTISQDLSLNLDDTMLLIYLGLMNKIDISKKNNETSIDFWIKASGVYFKFYKKNKHGNS
jgi:hypothetical protein